MFGGVDQPRLLTGTINLLKSITQRGIRSRTTNGIPIDKAGGRTGASQLGACSPRIEASLGGFHHLVAFLGAGPSSHHTRRKEERSRP